VSHSLVLASTQGIEQAGGFMVVIAGWVLTSRWGSDAKLNLNSGCSLPRVFLSANFDVAAATLQYVATCPPSRWQTVVLICSAQQHNGCVWVQNPGRCSYRCNIDLI
jgi:hypothetical protein